VHILFNLIAQLTICVQIEKLIGSFFYTPIYLLGGLGGNLLGANFGLIGLPSVGASGAIFTCIGIEIVDLIYNWKYVSRLPDLMCLMTEAHASCDGICRKLGPRCTSRSPSYWR